MKRETKARDREANSQQGDRQQQQLLQNSQINNSKTILAQEETLESGKKQKMSHCCMRGRWILLISMTIALIITAILIAMFTVTLLENEDQCLNSFPFQQPSYRLFATKTSYSTAYNYLNTTRRQQERDPASLPPIFSKTDSLKTLHYRLTSRGSSCRVRQLHYFGRHAARFPSSDAIGNLNKHLTNVQNRVDLSKFSLNTSNSNNTNSNKSNSTNNVCFNPLAQYKQWSSFMFLEQGNLVMDSGAEETQTIAQRLKSIYPEMFDSKQVKIEVGITEEIRTAQTALAFLQQVDNFTLGFCNLDQFPSGDIGDKSKANEITDNECYRNFIRTHRKDKLQFHKKCESYHKEPFPILHNLNLNEPNRTKFISSSVSRKLKLSKDDYLKPDETKALYDICKYESAFSGSSIWCNLFSDKDLKFYEYLSDVDDFFNQAYGHPDQMRSACPVTTELMKSFKAIRASQDSSHSQPEAHFYFTHSQVIQKMLAASVDLEQDPGYAIKSVLEHLNAGTSPDSRQWRTSLFTPFSANLAFTLYECPKTSKPPTSPDEYLEIDVSESPFKVIASLNEHPILLDGCSDYVCDLNELTTDSRIDREKRCKLEDICRKDIRVT